MSFPLRTFLGRFIANFLILSGLIILGYTYVPLLAGEFWYFLKSIKKQEYSLTAKNGVKQSVFAKYLTKDTIRMDPIGREFGIVIEKLNVNAPIVRNVSVVDEKAYNAALEKGVAHAIGSSFPGDRGNVYLFAHSAVGLFRFGKYAQTFNLLRKLENGDKVHVFFGNRDFTYEVINKEVIKGWDTRPLTRKTVDPILTLQTCDPPGTTFNRLVVTSKLVSVN
ncbi:MAG: class E sortase [Patescibacteria group bacterium]